MDGNIDFQLQKGNSSIIKVVGVGGGGNNALKSMYAKGIKGVDFVIYNTDAQALQNNPIENKVQLGVNSTQGLGAGAKPEVGEAAALESIEEIKESLGKNTKMVFVTAGMGGGTGTGAAPIIAKTAREMGILTVGIVTVPFSVEGKRRKQQAEQGLEKLRDNVDSLIVINNDRLVQHYEDLPFSEGLSRADEILTNAAKGMAEVITGFFHINIDFRDAETVLKNSGIALMSIGIASGEGRADEAVRKALDSPLLNDNKIEGAKDVLLLILSGNTEATMKEVQKIQQYIQDEAGNTAEIIFGTGRDESLGDAISVLVIATGFNKTNLNVTPAPKEILSLDAPTTTPQKKEEENNEVSNEQKSVFRLNDLDESTTEEATDYKQNNLLDDLDNEEETQTFAFGFEKKKLGHSEKETTNEDSNEYGDSDGFLQDDTDTEIQFDIKEKDHFVGEVSEVSPNDEAEVYEEPDIEILKNKEEVQSEEDSDERVKYSLDEDDSDMEVIAKFNTTTKTSPEIELVIESPQFIDESGSMFEENDDVKNKEDENESIIMEEKIVMHQNEEEECFVTEEESISNINNERLQRLAKYNTRYQFNDEDNRFDNIEIPIFRKK